MLISETLNLHPLNPQQNDQGRKGPCCFQRLNALKCLKCQKISKKYLILLQEVTFWINWREYTARTHHIFSHSASGRQKGHFYEGFMA